MNKNNMFKALCALAIIAVVSFCAGDAKSFAKSNPDVWSATFQLTWNDLMDKIVKGPIEFVGGNPPIANELNKQAFKAEMLSENSYYKVCAKKEPTLKKQIEDAIYKKFNEKSDILDKFDWTKKPNDAYFLYVMLVKNFEFLTPFDILPSERFANSIAKVKYFGIDKKSSFAMKKNVKVLFYNNDKDYAVSLLNKQNEEVILYRTNSNKDFDSIYSEIVKKTNPHAARFNSKDTLKVPFINVDKEISYDELTNKEIKNTDRLYIAKALQTIKFNMDNKGGKLKSEAAMDIMTMSLIQEIPRHYNFDKKFVLFLKEDGKAKPYFALRVENTDYLTK